MLKSENHGKHIAALYSIVVLLAVIASFLGYEVWFEHTHSLGL